MYSRTHPITLFPKNFLSRESSIYNNIEKSYICTHDQCDHNTNVVPPHYLNNYTPIFEHRFLPLIKENH